MDKNRDPVYSHNVVEFVAVANEFCKYAEHASELKEGEMLKILQRLLPFLYIKATFLPPFEPFFEDGNEKFVTEADWIRIHGAFKKQFGTADDYLEVFDERFDNSVTPVLSSLAENMADIYQDIKDFLLLYQTGTREVMNDALWECKMNFENIWGQKLVNSLRAIHNFIYSGEETGNMENEKKEDDTKRDTSEWFISKRQRDFRREGTE
jgi:hypothetical protein